MGDVNESEFKRRLSEAGNQLQNPPRHGLLQALEKVGIYLSMVNQSPSQSMLDAMRPSMDALVTPRLMRIRHRDVKLQILNCLSKITRITAPEVPYNDDAMEDIFTLIVESFRELGTMNSPSFEIRVSILKTVAEVRSCVIMLDLGLTDLLIDMFRHFFSVVSQNPYSSDVYDSMETIMSVVLDESDDIPQGILSVLRENLPREIQETPSAAQSLASNVVASCAEKLKPYL